MNEAEKTIRAIVHDRIEATRAKDVERATRHFSDDVLLFDVIDPLQHEGIRGAAKRAEQWFLTFVDAIGFEVSELRISIGEGVAFSHALHHVHGQTLSGPLDMWWRATTCYQIFDGVWKVTHEHNSVPFNPATGKASLDLQP